MLGAEPADAILPFFRLGMVKRLNAHADFRKAVPAIGGDHELPRLAA